MHTSGGNKCFVLLEEDGYISDDSEFKDAKEYEKLSEYI